MSADYRALCAELAEELVNEYGYCTEWEKGLPLCESNVSELLTRVRALLAQPEPQPVAVRERWPGPEDCDAEGRCWTTDYEPSLVYSPVWKMTELPRQNLGHDFSNAYFWRNVRFWIPANALPTPEAKPDV